MFRQVNVPASVPGRLYLHSMPGRYEPWERFVAETERAHVDLIVCLASEDEVRRRSARYREARLRNELPFRQRSFPIEDFGAPLAGERAVFRELVRELAAALAAGDRVLVHCGMGLGRTGVVATAALLELGLGASEARQAVAAAGSGAESSEQREFLDWYASQLENR